MAQAAKKESTVQVTLRLPTTQFKAIKAAAAREMRTINWQIVWMLENGGAR